MRKLLGGVLVFISLMGGLEAAQAAHRHHHPRVPPPPPVVVAHISVSSQSLYLTVNGWPSGMWAVSTAGVGYHTPRGTFRAQRLAKVWFSKKYDNSPMPNSVFFDGGIAIHGTYHVNSLGRAVSHGCVRLAPRNAEILYDLVETYGRGRTRIIVTD
jgi:lipoprotein-anchoring transpeptidase ErfK/SrfK